MTTSEQQIADVLNDYRDGLLDSVEEAVAAILAIIAGGAGSD